MAGDGTRFASLIFLMIITPTKDLEMVSHQFSSRTKRVLISLVAAGSTTVTRKLLEPARVPDVKKGFATEYMRDVKVMPRW